MESDASLIRLLQYLEDVRRDEEEELDRLQED